MTNTTPPPHSAPTGDHPNTIDHLWAITHTAGQSAHQRAASASDLHLASALNFAAYTLDLAADDLQAAGARSVIAESVDSEQGSAEFTPTTVMHLRDACVQVIDYTHNPDHAEAALAVLALTDDLAALLESGSTAAGPRA
jgi:hypothetical protein